MYGNSKEAERVRCMGIVESLNDSGVQEWYVG